MTAPNSEQLLAIEHQGGVILKAGAGSGKTFVLKEHMIYLCREWIRQYKENPQTTEFGDFIKGKLRKIVLMTFTNKAAGELEIRLNKEFKAVEGREVDDQKYWRSILENLHYLNVSTIHGFCFKLIKLGLLPGVASDQVIISELEYQDIIRDFIELWFNQQIKESSSTVDILLKDRKNFEEALMKIFADPTLRDMWNNTSVENLTLEQSEESLDELLDLHGLKEILNSEFKVRSFPEFEKKNWFEFLVKLEPFLQDKEKGFFKIIKLNSFFSEMDYKIPRKPSGKTLPPEILNHYETVILFKDFLKKNGKSLQKFVDLFSSHVVPWFSYLKSAVDYVEYKYGDVDGVTYSDLEYIVFEKLKNDDVCKSIAEHFEYFIIDEFQDTSFIQFSIIERIIKSNFQKIFCVGDLKQAIYGFRGGELGVFLGAETKVSKVLLLNNNYRSDKNIIDFNNDLFSYLFTRGVGFSGEDPHSVPVDFQKFPETKESLGVVRKVNLSLDEWPSKEKLSNIQVDFIEAHGILERLEIARSSKVKTAILYKRLKPSLLLIDLLIQKGLSFTAQIKIPFLDDPILGIFKILLDYEFDRNEAKEEILEYYLNSYLSILGFVKTRYSKKVLQKYFLEMKLYNQYQAFCSLLENLGVSNANYSNNLSEIKTLIKRSFGDREKLVHLLKLASQKSYSFDFQYGDNPGEIIIMSAHASKGLEFSNVILGGIYTNENTIRFTSSVGKFPLSFKWGENIHGKQNFKTPLFLLEEELVKQKEFSESKRLFYVACTRAENSLEFIDIDFGELKRSRSSSSNWIAGLRTWMGNQGDGNILEEVDLSYRTTSSEEKLNSLDKRPPLFHTDSLGLIEKGGKNSLSYLPELSVTRLATLADCPQKFYFESICKLEVESLDFLEINHVKNNSRDKDSSERLFSNSSERGTLVHDEISRLILAELKMSEIEFKSQNKSILDWIVENLSVFMENSNLISEKSIKFELFNYMISGIPDLIIESKENSQLEEIWDFKTGRIAENKLNPYWFQLYCYAYARFKSSNSNLENKMKLVLCFVDEEKKLEKTISFLDVEKYLTENLSMLSSLDTKNTNSCEYCSYKNICQK